MAYTKPTLTGYNANPPSDDGAQTAANRVDWAKHVEKIGNPLRVYADAINNNVSTALDGASEYHPTIAAMTAITSPEDGRIVTVTEAGRGGFFVFDTSATASGNTGTTFSAGDGTSGSWVRRYSGAVNVLWFGADDTGVLDSRPEIQAAIDAHRGIVMLPTGTYRVDAPIELKEERILVGEGAGAYFQGTGYDRLSVIKPSVTFAGSAVIDIDPANTSAGLSYVYGVALRDLCIDCISITNAGGTIINIASLSNTETFDSVRVINNNTNIGLSIGISANASALESDGLSFNNIYFLQSSSGGSTTNPVLRISSANEVSFRDSKFQRGALATTVGSTVALISASTGRAVNGVTFDSCAFAGAEVGLRIQGNAADGQGPRWARVQNCTFEGPRYPVYISGTADRPAQFHTIGPGNRMFDLEAGGSGIVLDAYASNNTVFADELISVLFNTNAGSNTLFGAGTFTDSGTDNVRIFRNNNGVDFNRLYIEEWTRPALGASWVDTTASRSQAGYKKDTLGNVYLRGYLTAGLWGFPNHLFTLPAGYRPPVSGRAFEIAATGDAGVAVKITILDTGEVFGVGSGTQLCLDGIVFPAH